MIAFTLQRLASDALSTAGNLSGPNGDHLCATLEPRAAGIPHPRIQAGTYPLRLRNFGESRFDAGYRKDFGDAFRGMIEIASVPGRTFVEFHTGNSSRDTEGCIIGGLRTTHDAQLGYVIPGGESKPGWWNAYRVLVAAIESEGASLTVKDVPAPEAAVA